LQAVKGKGGRFDLDDNGIVVLLGLSPDAIDDAMRQAMKTHEAELEALLEQHALATLEHDLDAIATAQRSER
jgi:hypothetical protein